MTSHRRALSALTPQTAQVPLSHAATAWMSSADSRATHAGKTGAESQQFARLRGDEGLAQQLLSSAFMSFCPKGLRVLLVCLFSLVHAFTILFLLGTYYVPDMVPDTKDAAGISVTKGHPARGLHSPEDSRLVDRCPLMGPTLRVALVRLGHAALIRTHTTAKPKPLATAPPCS